MKIQRLAGYCTGMLNRLDNQWWEWTLGVRTGGRHESLHPDAHRYESFAYATHFAVLEHLSPQPSDVVLDLGCGKGRVLCVAATRPVQEVVGVEIDPELCSVAEKNAARHRRRRAPIRVVCGAAEEFRFDAATIIIAFNPFGAETFARVLKALRLSLVKHPRNVRIAYSNPVHAAVMNDASWLECYSRWQPTTWSRLKFSVRFYRSLPRL